MVVVDVSDDLLAVVVEIQGLLEELSRGRHILLEHTAVRIRIACVFADAPKMRRAEQGVERGIIRIILKSCLKLGLHFRDRVVLVAVINIPESLDRRIARAVARRSSSLFSTTTNTEKAECENAQE